jgi:NTE family protein
LSWLSVLQSRSFGRAGVFEPSPQPWFARAIGIYRLAPLARQLERPVDFDRLNSGDIRVSVVATDLGTGELAIFDTAAGNAIGPRHILASCGFIPEFEPTEVDGRLLGDGGLVANAPIELVLANRTGDDDLICFILDLFARDTGPPSSLEDSAGLRRDLLLSAPTHRVLDALSREDALRRLLATAAQQIPAKKRGDARLAPVLEGGRSGSTRVLHLSYRPGPGEAGPEKQFDFSRASLFDRRDAGAEDMIRALELLRRDEASGGFVLFRVRR